MSDSSNDILKSISLLRELTVDSHESAASDVNVSLKTIAGNSVSTDPRSGSRLDTAYPCIGYGVLIPYLEYGVLSHLDTAYWSLFLCGLWSLIFPDMRFLNHINHGTIYDIAIDPITETAITVGQVNSSQVKRVRRGLFLVFHLLTDLIVWSTCLTVITILYFQSYPLTRTSWTRFNADDYAVLVAHPALLQKFPEPFLCLVGMSRNYTLDEDTYSSFLYDDMDLFIFIQVADPTKVKVVERERAEGKAKPLDSTVGRVVLLLPISPARAESEVEASLEKLFDEGGSTKQGDSTAGGSHDGTSLRILDMTVEDTFAGNATAERPRCQHKKRRVVTNASGSSHPSKKLREDHETSSEAATGGKSSSVLKELLASSILHVETSVKDVATLPLVTSSVSATSERESGAPTDSVTRLNLRTIGPSERFVISSYSSHHSSTNAAKAGIDSFVRSVVPPPVMTEVVVTTNIASIPSVLAPKTGTKVISLVYASMFNDSDSMKTVRPDTAGSSHIPGKDLSMGSAFLGYIVSADGIIMDPITEIRSLRLTHVSGKIHRKLGELVLSVSTAFHLKPMFSQRGSWDEYLLLGGVCYNNSWPASIKKAAPFELLYGENVEHLFADRDRRVSDNIRRDSEFQDGDPCISKELNPFWIGQEESQRYKTYTAYSDQLNMAYLSSDTCMTRNSTRELLSPFENLKQKFCSKRRLFDTPSLVESNSPEFDHNFDILDLSEEEEVILFYNGIDVPTRQILDSKGVIPSKIVVDSKIAIQEMAEYSQKWHNGTSSRTGKYKTFEGYATSKLTQQSRTRNKESKCESVFCLESAKRHKENSNIIKEIRASTDAAIRNQGALIKILEIQIGQMSKVLQERGFGSLPSHERNPRDQVKSILTAKADFSGIRRIGCGLYVISGTQHRSILSETIPFPKRLQNFSCDDWRKAQDVKILDAYYHTLPIKEKDPWNFTLPCFIYNICFDKALVNLGASFTIIDDDDMAKDVVLGMKFCKKYASCQMIMKKFALGDKCERIMKDE
ncbi:hypothetical protein Tco_1503810 [Tanacetum coccineum]